MKDKRVIEKQNQEQNENENENENKNKNESGASYLQFDNKTNL